MDIYQGLIVGCVVDDVLNIIPTVNLPVSSFFFFFQLKNVNLFILIGG